LDLLRVTEEIRMTEYQQTQAIDAPNWIVSSYPPFSISG
jgi:hypothetical protein